MGCNLRRSRSTIASRSNGNRHCSLTCLLLGRDQGTTTANVLCRAAAKRVHVMQYERFGGIEAFLKEYVKEVAFDPGYPHGPLEREARRLAEGTVKNPSQ